MNEFGYQSITETFDSWVPFSDETELQERESSNAERVYSDEYSWAGRSLRARDSRLTADESRNSCKLSSFRLRRVLALIQYLYRDGWRSSKNFLDIVLL